MWLESKLIFERNKDEFYLVLNHSEECQKNILAKYYEITLIKYIN